MGDEAWLHHSEPKTKQHSVEWHHANLPKKKKFKSALLAGKVMAAVSSFHKGLCL
jgi:hypothetical protein